MAIKPMEGLAPEWYEPEREEKDDNGNPVEIAEGEQVTGFKIRPLTGPEYLDAVETPGMPGVKKAFRYALEDWRNFTDQEFSSALAYELIPPKYMLMIGNRILAISTWNGEKSKN